MKPLLWIGCGFVGQLFFYQYSSVYAIVATSTNPEKHPLHRDYPQQIKHYRSPNPNQLQSLLQETEVLVITVASKNGASYENTYLTTVQDLLFLSPAKNLKQIIYCSSTSVYGDREGKAVDETALLNPQSDLAKILIESEKRLIQFEKKHSIPVCILRLGEIYHLNQNPYLRLKNQNPIVLPDTKNNYTNMVHAEDVILAIHHAITCLLSGIYNLCQKDHLLRKELYQKIQATYGLSEIIYDSKIKSLHGGNKYVLSDKIEQSGFTFRHDHTEVPFV